jgi:hypothetical protein
VARARTTSRNPSTLRQRSTSGIEWSAVDKSSTSELVWHLREHTIPAALALLPGRMDTIDARAMLFATGYQESAFNARIQGGKGTRPGKGPAHGFWQFEAGGGVKEILSSPDTAPIIAPICRMFLFEPKPAIIHDAIADHDVLAACLARLLLYRDPRPMPHEDQSEIGWSIYLRNWRPGAPRPDDWPANFARAWSLVKGLEHAET